MSTVPSHPFPYTCLWAIPVVFVVVVVWVRCWGCFVLGWAKRGAVLDDVQHNQLLPLYASWTNKKHPCGNRSERRGLWDVCFTTPPEGDENDLQPKKSSTQIRSFSLLASTYRRAIHFCRLLLEASHSLLSPLGIGEPFTCLASRCRRKVGGEQNVSPIGIGEARQCLAYRYRRGDTMSRLLYLNVSPPTFL